MVHRATHWTPATFAGRLAASARRGSIPRWTAFGIIGVLLGIYTMGVFSLPPRWAPFFVVAALCPFLAMIAGNVRRLLLAIIILDIPLNLDIHLGYHTEAAALGAIGGLGISVTTMCLVALYVLWLGDLLARVKSPPRLALRMSLPLALYVALAGLSLLAAQNLALGVYEVFLLIQTFLLYVYVVDTVRTRDDVLFVVTMLLAGLVLESMIMAGLGIVGRAFSVSGIGSRVDATAGTSGQFFRVAGTIGAPNGAAAYLSLLLAPAISLLLTQLSSRHKWLAMLAFVFGGMALVLTFSRSGWVAFALSVSIVCLLGWRRGWLPASVPVVTTVIVLLLSLLFREAIMVRMSDAVSAQSRVPLMKLAFRMIGDHPVLGIGANNFAVTIRQYATPEFGRDWLYNVHNTYLLVWAEKGSGAFLALLFFLLATIRRGWQCWELNDRFLSPLALGFTAAVIGHMTHMLVDLFNDRPQVQLLWFIAAVITATHHVAIQGSPQHRQQYGERYAFSVR